MKIRKKNVKIQGWTQIRMPFWIWSRMSILHDWLEGRKTLSQNLIMEKIWIRRCKSVSSVERMTDTSGARPSMAQHPLVDENVSRSGYVSTLMIQEFILVGSGSWAWEQIRTIYFVPRCRPEENNHEDGQGVQTQGINHHIRTIFSLKKIYPLYIRFPFYFSKYRFFMHARYSWCLFQKLPLTALHFVGHLPKIFFLGKGKVLGRFPAEDYTHWHVHQSRCSHACSDQQAFWQACANGHRCPWEHKTFNLRKIVKKFW